MTVNVTPLPAMQGGLFLKNALASRGAAGVFQGGLRRDFRLIN